MSLTSAKEAIFLHVAPALRHYDRYPLLCSDEELSLQIARFLNQARYSWAPTTSASKPSLVRLKARTPMQLDELCKLLDSLQDGHMTRHPFPQLFDQAVAADAKLEGCPLREGIRHAGAREIVRWKESAGADKTLDLWMAGDVRLQMLSALFKDYLPRNALRNMDQIPALLQVFMLHLQNPRDFLACWPKQPEALQQQLVSGIWIGLPQRSLSLSAKRLDEEAKDQELQTEGLMMGIFIHLRTLLMTRFRVSMHYTEGLLLAALNEALASNNNQFGPHLKQQPELKRVWSETWETNSWVIQRMVEEAKVVRKVLHRMEPPNGELEQALRAGLAFQRLSKAKIYQQPGRVWRAAEWRLLSEDQVRHRLLLHCAPSAYNDLDHHHHSDNGLQFLEILDGTTAGSVLKGLGGSNLKSVWCTPLASDTTKLQRPSTLLGIPPGRLWAYLRWASFKTLQQQRSYAYSPQVFQLFHQTDDHLAWVYAVDIMRQWLGMDALPLPDEPERYAIEVDFFRSTLLRVLEKVEKPEDFCTVGLLAVYMLSFREDELALLNPATRAEALMPQSSFSMLGDKGDWYFVMERVTALGPAEALQFLRAKVRLAAGDRGGPEQMKLVSKNGGVYDTAVLATQKARMKPSRFVPVERKCCCSENNNDALLVTALMVLEQMGPKDARAEIEIVRPKLDAMPFGSCRDSCLLFNDFPIGWQRTENGCQEIYVDSTFGVLDIDYNSSDGATDVSDLYTYYGAKFRGLIEDSMHQDMSKYPRSNDSGVNEETDEEEEKKKQKQQQQKKKRKQPEGNTASDHQSKKARVVEERFSAVYTRQSIELPGPGWSTCGSSQDIPFTP